MPLASLPKLIKPAPVQTESSKPNNQLYHFSHIHQISQKPRALDFCSDLASFFFMSGQGRGDRTVKIVIINTKYVETDAMSFKDVVQKLTGKDSRVAYEVQEPPAVTNNKSTSTQFSNFNEIRLSPMTNSNSNPVGLMSRSNSSVMMRNISFKEFERLFREMPPMEEFGLIN